MGYKTVSSSVGDYFIDSREYADILDGTLEHPSYAFTFALRSKELIEVSNVEGLKGLAKIIRKDYLTSKDSIIKMHRTSSSRRVLKKPHFEG